MVDQKCDDRTPPQTRVNGVGRTTGGVGFIIKSDMECQRIICDSEYICFIKIGVHRYNWLLGSIYMNCEGIRGEVNVLKMRCVKEVISKAKEDGLNIMIGGDMNAHIWELDICENKNGKLLKSVMDEINLQILNSVWDSMKGATWFSENSE